MNKKKVHLSKFGKKHGEGSRGHTSSDEYEQSNESSPVYGGGGTGGSDAEDNAPMPILPKSTTEFRYPPKCPLEGIKFI